MANFFFCLYERRGKCYCPIIQPAEEEMVKNTREYLDAFKDLPYVFNLGHGLLPETDPDKVSKLIKFYREY